MLQKFKSNMAAEIEELQEKIPMSLSVQSLSYERRVYSQLSGLLEMDKLPDTPTVVLSTGKTIPSTLDPASAAALTRYIGKFIEWKVPNSIVDKPTIEFISRLTQLHSLLKLRSLSTHQPKNIILPDMTDKLDKIIAFCDTI